MTSSSPPNVLFEPGDVMAPMDNRLLYSEEEQLFSRQCKEKAYSCAHPLGPNSEALDTLNGGHSCFCLSEAAWPKPELDQQRSASMAYR